VTPSIPPRADVQAAMSAFVLISSASHLAPDIADTLRIRGVMTQLRHFAVVSFRTRTSVANRFAGRGKPEVRPAST
jgi:hypothetical protein